MMVEIKPCPLCGTKVNAKMLGGRDWCIIKCEKCGLEMVSQAGIEKLTALWNRRVNDE